MSIKDYVFRSRLGILLLLFTSALIAFSEVLIALSMKKGLEIVLESKSEQLPMLIGIFIGIILLSVFGYYLKGVSGAYYKKSILTSLKDDYVDSLINMSIKEFQTHKIGEISSTMTNDINKLETQYFDVILKSVQQGMSFLFASVTMVYFSPMLTLCIYLLVIVVMFAPRKTHKQMSDLGLAFSNTMADYSTKIQEILGGFEVIKSFGATKKMKSEIQILSKESEEARFQIGKKESKVIGILGGLSLITFYIPFLIGTIFVLNGSIEVGVLMAVVNLSGSIINPVQQFGGNMASLKVGEGIFNNILKTINRDSLSVQTNQKIDTPSISSNLCLKHGITLENVSFSYKEQPILKDISMQLDKGKKYLVIGPSGSGKSTLLKVLMGFYDDYSGSIKIDDLELKDINKNDLSKLIAYVPQDVFMFNRSIRENIIFNSPLNEEKLEKVCKQAALEDVINELEDGLDTVLGDGSQKLSGGQMQRIAIARALYHEAKILLVDEATASLDEHNSIKINDILLSLNQMVIYVTHKMPEEQLVKFDQIIKMENGSVEYASE